MKYTRLTTACIAVEVMECSMATIARKHLNMTCKTKSFNFLLERGHSFNYGSLLDHSNHHLQQHIPLISGSEEIHVKEVTGSEGTYKQQAASQ